ncbi:MAG: alpha-glucosidase [Candidatus Lokiarchaeota archaeon]|nr:alpha-glucosidase [Candidatus Lokiarchaeota archaeon]
MLDDKFKWWQKTVVYQVYPRSFKDTTGNGIGDLQGIIEKLEYLQELGVETIWFSPFYPSPTSKPYSQHDCGYDISYYKDIHPEYGTMEIFDTLVKEIHDRDMKIVLDMVLNHTSIEHPWFKESRSSRDNPKRDWYIWKDGQKPNGKKPPNNWNSIIGKAWEYDPHTDQWFYHAFLPFQPDLNYRNPEVQREMLDTVRFWLNRGVDGYRLDIINSLFEDAQFRNAPFIFKLHSEDSGIFFKSTEMTLNHPDTYEFCKILRATIDEFSDKFLVGEVTASFKMLKNYLGDVSKDGISHDGLNLVFLFQSMNMPMKSKKFRNLMQMYEKWFPYPYTPTWVFGNHDQIRRITKIGDNFNKAKINATLQLTARGVPFIYYGDEIAMKEGKTSKKNSRDAISYHFNWVPQFVRNIVGKYGISVNRDGCRTPMQWDDSENAGFCPQNIEPWLPIDRSFIKRNVQKEEKDVSSLLNCYKKLLKVRRESLALQIGDFELIDLKGLNKICLAYHRIYDNQKIYVFLNFANKELFIESPLSNPKLLFSTLPNKKALDLKKYEGNLKLTPFECVIFK